MRRRSGRRIVTEWSNTEKAIDRFFVVMDVFCHDVWKACWYSYLTDVDLLAGGKEASITVTTIWLHKWANSSIFAMEQRTHSESDFSLNYRFFQYFWAFFISVLCHSDSKGRTFESCQARQKTPVNTTFSGVFFFCSYSTCRSTFFKPLHTGSHSA